MPCLCLGLRWFHILATGVMTAGLASGCELVVGELPQAVDSVEEPGSADSGTSNGTGGRGTGGVAFGDTGGAGSGGSPSDGGSGSHGGTGTGGSAQSGNGGASDGGATSSTGGEPTGGIPGAGAQLSMGGDTGNGGRSTTGGAPNTGGRIGSGGAGACKNPPCDCDGDGGNAVGCNGGDDCDDTDPLVYKNEPFYYATPSLHRGYDYDCSNTPDYDPALNKYLQCGLLSLALCDTTTQAYLQSAPPACGQGGPWGGCIPSGLLCVANPRDNVVMRCR